MQRTDGALPLGSLQAQSEKQIHLYWAADPHYVTQKRHHYRYSSSLQLQANFAAQDTVKHQARIQQEQAY